MKYVVVGTSSLTFFDLKFATTGLNDSKLEKYDREVKTFYTEERVRPSFMRDDDIKVGMKIFYDVETEVSLGDNSYLLKILLKQRTLYR